VYDCFNLEWTCSNLVIAKRKREEEEEQKEKINKGISKYFNHKATSTAPKPKVRNRLEDLNSYV
jgi:hypothetical protein